MNTHPLPNPKQLRQIPAQFSWIDQRLVRDDYFSHCSCEALALYLFLLTVADPRGLSYYGQPSLMKQLQLGAMRFHRARQELIHNRLITYQHPLYQVLALDKVTNLSQTPQADCAPPSKRSIPPQLQQLRQQLASGMHHD